MRDYGLLIVMLCVLVLVALASYGYKQTTRNADSADAYRVEMVFLADGRTTCAVTKAAISCWR
jgi:hypothetical protein